MASFQYRSPNNETKNVFLSPIIIATPSALIAICGILVASIVGPWRQVVRIGRASCWPHRCASAPAAQLWLARGLVASSVGPLAAACQRRAGVVLAPPLFFHPRHANIGVQVDGLPPAASVSWSRGRAVVWSAGQSRKRRPPLTPVVSAIHLSKVHKAKGGSPLFSLCVNSTVVGRVRDRQGGIPVDIRIGLVQHLSRPPSILTVKSMLVSMSTHYLQSDFNLIDERRQ